MRKLWLPFVLVAVSLVSAQETRHFTFHYGFTVRNVPVGEGVRVWIPAAHSDQFQEVKVISASGDLGLKKEHESRFGNEMFYADVSHVKQADLHFEVVYDVLRHERLTLGVARPHLAEVELKDRDRKLFLQPDKLVPVTGLPAELAVKVTGGQVAPLDKARAIYDYVLTTMRYDKSGTGWGRGDVLYACDAKKGNCTDFHSLFIAMARSQGIPARFEIGFPLSPDQHSVEIAGYHCWADFFEPNDGWIRWTFRRRGSIKKSGIIFWRARCEPSAVHHGTRPASSPPQDGPLLNYFVYPYVEVGGKEHPNVALAFSFADVDAVASVVK